MKDNNDCNYDCCMWSCFPCLFSIAVCEKLCICPFMCCASMEKPIGNSNEEFKEGSK